MLAFHYKNTPRRYNGETKWNLRPTLRDIEELPVRTRATYVTRTFEMAYGSHFLRMGVRRDGASSMVDEC
jgi:hypothetical protein